MADRRPDGEAGLPIGLLTRRLAETPAPFLGDVVVAAVLSDVLADLGHEPLVPDWQDALAPPPDRTRDAARVAWQRACAVLAWLLADPMVGGAVSTSALTRFLGGDLHTLSRHVPASAMVEDPERREEVARLLLRAAGVPVAGETPAQSADRLATLDTATRLRVIEGARAAEEHARQVREALARKRAQEAAAKASRE